MKLTELDTPHEHENGQHSVIIHDPKFGIVRRFLNTEADAKQELATMPVGKKNRNYLLNAREALEKIRAGRIIVESVDLEVLAAI